MTEKIKVSQGIANVIDRYITRNIKNYELSLESAMEDLIVCHPNIDWEDYLDGEFGELENITTYDLMQVLVLGYEVETTPEDIIRNRWNSISDSSVVAKKLNDKESLYRCNGIKDGIETTLNALNIKIKGIND